MSIIKVNVYNIFLITITATSYHLYVFFQCRIRKLIVFLFTLINIDDITNRTKKDSPLPTNSVCEKIKGYPFKTGNNYI